MKRSVKHKSKYGIDYIQYEDKTIYVEVYRDGSGVISIDTINFSDSSGKHKDRIQELKRRKRVLNKALKTLEQIENPKIYFP